MSLADQFVGQAGAVAQVAPDKFLGFFNGLLDRADTQLAVRDTQNDLGSGLEAELAAYFGGDDDPPAFGHFGSKCCHEGLYVSRNPNMAGYSKYGNACRNWRGGLPTGYGLACSNVRFTGQWTNCV
jgi:hypothetical protein